MPFVQREMEVMMVRLEDMRVGSIVRVRGSFGRGPAVLARVDEVERDIKNGRPGIAYVVLDTKDEHWAYLEQVDRVVTY